MRDDSPDDDLSGMLREARPQLELPPRFADAVWRRIRRTEELPRPTHDWLARLVSRLLCPQWAVAGLTATLVLGATLGTLQGQRSAREMAQTRYLASVAPEIVR